MQVYIYGIGIDRGSWWCPCCNESGTVSWWDEAVNGAKEHECPASM